MHKFENNCMFFIKELTHTSKYYIKLKHALKFVNIHFNNSTLTKKDLKKDNLSNFILV